jgi:hypothetical protein
MAIRARQRFLQREEKRKWVRFFGPTLGEGAYKVAQAKPVRTVGRGVLNMGLFPKFRKLQPKDEVRSWE